MRTTLQGLRPLDVGVLDCLELITGRAKQCAKSSLVHLEKAQRVAALDPEMAIFRVLTAEEEAATSVFLAVRQRGYTNADRLKHRNHTHKQALIPFLMAVNNYIGGTKPPPPPTRFVVRDDGATKRLLISVRLPDGRWMEPQPPLNFSIRGVVDGKPALFRRELEEIALEAGKSSVQKYLADCANLRNQLLYASDAGVPEVREGLDDILAKGRWRVFILLRTLCLIFPYKERAGFVQQALDAFLIALGAVEEGDLEW